MNIESKRYQVRGIGLANIVNIYDKQGGLTAIVNDAPSSEQLAALTEAEFDRQCKASMKKGTWVYA